MEATTLKLPEKLEEDEFVRLSATWEEYLDALEEADPTLTIQFLNHEIIMSQATDTHELLVMRLGTLLNLYFDQFEDYQVFGSNVKIVTPTHSGDFNADASVVKTPIEYGLTPSGRISKMRIQNPEIVVEVLSKSTRKFDLEEKLSYYKLISSVQHILFVDQQRPYASVYSRLEQPDEWLNHDYRTLEAIVRLGTVTLPMADIYRKVTF
jgi:Uma2 family endonuclease